MSTSHHNAANRYILKNISRLVFSALIIPVSAQIMAAEITNENYELAEIKVENNPVNSSQVLIDQHDLELLGARSLEDALRLVPSVNTRYGGDGTPRMDIRGLRTRQVKLLLNGIPFNSTFDGQFDPSLIPAFAIGKIDLNIGSSSVLYGDGGMAGVMDIKTRNAMSGFQASSKLERGSDDFWLANGQVGYGDADQDFYFGYGVRERDGFSLSNDFTSPLETSADNFQDNDQRRNSDDRRENLIFSYNRNLTEKLTIGMFASYLEGQYGKPPIVFDNNVDDFAQRARFERVESQRGFSLQLGGDYQLADNWSTRLWFFENQLEERSASYDDNSFSTITTNNTFARTEQTKTHGSHAQLTGVFPTTGSKVAFSFDQRKESYDEAGLECTISGGGGAQTCPSRPFTQTSSDESIRVKSYAAELTQPLAFDITAVLGIARHELDKSGNTDESTHSGQFSLTKPITEISTLYGTIARKVDAPTIRQLFEQGSGNSELGFQRAKHYEVGVKNQWQKGALNIAFWQSDIKDFIEKDNITDVFENRDKLRFKGVDIDGGYQFTDKLTINAGLGFLSAEDKSSDATTERLQYRPSHKASLQAIYQLTPQWQLSGDIIRIGSQNYFNRKDSAIRDKLDSFELVNTRLKYTLANQKADFYVGVENLLDEDYSTSYGYPQAGRFVYTGVNLRWK